MASETVEAKDRCGIWYRAKIVAVRGEGDGREVKAHFLGWAKRFDEWLLPTAHLFARRAVATSSRTSASLTLRLKDLILSGKWVRDPIRMTKSFLNKDFTHSVFPQ